MRQLSHICLPGELIFDPFAGSGTTGVGALMEGRRFIGVEKIASYADVARRRMAAVEAAPTLFPEKFTAGALDLDYPEPEDLAPDLDPAQSDIFP